MNRCRAGLASLLLVAAVASPLAGQTRARRLPPKAASPKAVSPKAVPPTTEPAQLECPSPLGTGVSTRRSFCDVLTGRDPAGGTIIKLPPHTGPVTLTFDLHNRHTYSEELLRTNRGYRKYTAVIGVLTADNTLLSRFVVQNEFRSAADLVDRISGGAGPGGVKAVAPTGTETITVTIDEAEDSVSLLGEKLTVIRPDGTDTFNAPGRPIAIVSNPQITYRAKPPAPPARKPAARRTRR